MDTSYAQQQEKIFQEYKSLLFSIAYRMLGSVMDAEDCMQEAFLQWHAAGQKEEIRNPKAYLCTLVTRRCIDRLHSAQAKRETYVGLWLPEPLIDTTTDPANISELSESLSMAFLLLLERLSPVERAVFLLRQVFDYDYPEIAHIVGKSAENCRQLMHRARQHLPANSNPAQTPTYEQQQQIFTQFLQAYLNGDMDSLLHTLSDEIVLQSDGGGKVHTALNPLHGSHHVARYLLGIQQKLLHYVKTTIRLEPINGQPGLIVYLQERSDEEQSPDLEQEKQETWWDRDVWYRQAADTGAAALAMAVTCGDSHVQEIDIIVNPEKLQHLPPLTADAENTIAL